MKSLKYVEILQCLFEAQDPSAFSLLEFDCDSLVLSNSLDAYTFGYVLVHAPIKWNLISYPTAFEALLSSLTHHVGPDNNILGSIGPSLILRSEVNPHSFPIEKLPKNVCLSINHLSLTINAFLSFDGFITGLSVLHNLSSVNIELHTCQQDFLLFKAFRKLKNLRKVELQFHSCEVTTEGEKELLNFFTNNESLEDVKIYFFSMKSERNIKSSSKCTFVKSLIKGVLSLSTITSFTTNVPFLSTKFPCSLKELRFEILTGEWSRKNAYFYTTAEISHCIFCISELCKKSSLKLVSITEKGKTFHGFMEWKSIFNNPYYFFSPSPRIYSNFLSILNKSLHANSTIETLELNFCNIKPLNNIDLISHAVRRDPSNCMNIRRSKSLSDLLVPFVSKLITLPRRYMRKLKRLPKSKLFSLAKSCSCPDLLELESLCTLYPLLHKNLYDNNHQQFVPFHV